MSAKMADPSNQEDHEYSETPEEIEIEEEQGAEAAARDFYRGHTDLPQAMNKTFDLLLRLSDAPALKEHHLLPEVDDLIFVWQIIIDLCYGPPKKVSEPEEGGEDPLPPPPQDEPPAPLAPGRVLRRFDDWANPLATIPEVDEDLEPTGDALSAPLGEESGFEVTMPIPEPLVPLAPARRRKFRGVLRRFGAWSNPLGTIPEADETPSAPLGDEIGLSAPIPLLEPMEHVVAHTPETNNRLKRYKTNNRLELILVENQNNSALSEPSEDAPLEPQGFPEAEDALQGLGQLLQEPQVVIDGAELLEEAPAETESGASLSVFEFDFRSRELFQTDAGPPAADDWPTLTEEATFGADSASMASSEPPDEAALEPKGGEGDLVNQGEGAEASAPQQKEQGPVPSEFESDFRSAAGDAGPEAPLDEDKKDKKPSLLQTLKRKKRRLALGLDAALAGVGLAILVGPRIWTRASRFARSSFD